MEIDREKIVDAVLGLLWLTLHDERRAWRGHDWEALDRLHRKGLIADPANKSKSVILSDEGLRRAEELFRTLFMRLAPCYLVRDSTSAQAPALPRKTNNVRKFFGTQFGATQRYDRIAAELRNPVRGGSMESCSKSCAKRFGVCRSLHR